MIFVIPPPLLRDGTCDSFADIFRNSKYHHSINWDGLSKTSIGEEENLEKAHADNKDGSRGGEADDMQVILPDSNLSISPLKEQEKKRPRRDGDGDDVLTNTNIRSMLSFEESDRAQ